VLRSSVVRLRLVVSSYLLNSTNSINAGLGDVNIRLHDKFHPSLFFSGQFGGKTKLGTAAF